MKRPLNLSIPILLGLLAWSTPLAKSQEMFGWWPLNEGTGDTANDISGNDLSALINNVDFGGLGDGESAWAEDPDFGTVLSFNGIDNSGAYAVVGNPPDSGTLPIFTTDAGSEFTWSFWAKSEQGSNNDIILGNRYSPFGGDFAPRQFIKFTTRMFEWDTNNVQGLDYDDIPQGIWMHHVVVKTGTELTYYRDGFQSGFRTIVAAPQDPQPLYFGGQGVENWAGYMSDVRLYSTALSEAEIQIVYENRGIFSTEDDDEDGLPDAWEEALVDNLDDLNGSGAGPGPGSGTGDFDGDGLTDIDEYEETKTDPTKVDTDEDELSDAVETNTGTYVSATDTGTNPKKADSDGDGLIDSVETNTGEFVDEENTGTDPNNADTDGDGYSDGGEIAGGTDPNDENSKGAIPAPILYLDFEDSAVDLSGNANDGEVNGDVTFDAEGAEGGPTSTTGANFNGGYLNIPGVDMSGIIQDIQGENSYTLSAWIKPSDLGGNKFLWGQTSQGIHNGIRNGGFLHQAHWGADTNGATNLSTLEGQWIHAAWVYDGDADVGTIYLNGEVDWTGGKRAPNGSGNLLVGGSNGGGDNYRGLVDDVAVWREVLPEGSIQALADGTSPIGASQEDADGDGLPDSWEEKYGVDDPEGDDDNDGLTNIEEYELRTKPNKADSDEDGLTDKEEIEVHKTNPLNPDKDRDGLLDGEEIAAGTDPENKDTDGDGISDFNEIQDGTDPLVVTAIAFETNLVSYWPLDSDFDDAKAENHGVEEGGPIEFQTGKFDGAIYLNGSQSIEISGDENTFDFAGESFTVSAWYTAEAINKSWQCLVAKGEGNGWRVHRRGGDNPPEMTFTGGNGDVARHNVAMTVGGDPETWHHVAGVTDASTQEEILYLDGEEVARKAGATLQDRGNPMRIGDNPDARNRNWQGKVDDLAVWGRALSPIEIAEIWDGGSGKSIEEMLGLSVPFDFTSVIYDAQEDSFRFEWNSKPNRTYALYFSETLEEFDADVDDSIES
ncbi:MAG: LamG-like jellyroll fold domain-containing protein, partial [Verrucomicrobiota bacterium]|nr:LamG-like jellyroll fold domain-containing protein [Verrucomicrobiota bacterium]